MTTTAVAHMQSNSPGVVQTNISKKKRKKKKRISKHVLAAKQAAGNAGSREHHKVKDPTDIQEYLTNWKRQQEDDTVEWKFNKNTQSWLIRHAYEADKVPKATFVLLLEYLLGVKSGDTKKRLILDATRRASRYKQYEKSKKEKERNKSVLDASNAEREANSQQDSFQQQNQPQTYVLPQSAPVGESKEDEDQKRWLLLDDRHKRKEYKRARKILDKLRDPGTLT